MLKRKKTRFFTLMEMVVVIAIIALLAAIVTPMYFKHVKTARINACKTQISLLGQAVDDYRLDTGKLPRSLNDLLTNGSGAKKWNGPYLQASKIPPDPWGNDYVFVMPGKYGDYDLYSYGEAGPGGGSTSDGVIGNWSN
ncbi:MAG: type II secretion system major pseudopilin GspG [Lentisphaerota bacterium]